MKFKKIEYLIRQGKFSHSKEFERILDEVKRAIELVKWPKGADSFTIYPKRKGNGVKPIKNRCMKSLKKDGWDLEVCMLLGSRQKPGAVDAIKKVGPTKSFVVEWETGNISSSHRALNKMALGMIKGILHGGILILPSRDLYNYLTDRVGSFSEIEPYFDIWKNLHIHEGVLAVIEVEYDALSEDVSKIPKGTDGWARK